MIDQDDPLGNALAWTQAGKKAAFATVIKTWGSSPRPAGSQMAVAADGGFAGSISGGCIEGAAIQESLESIKSGKPKIMDFLATNDMAWQVGLACGGEVRVLIAPAPETAAIRRLVERKPAALVTDVATGDHAVIERDAASGSLRLSADALARARTLIAADKAGFVDPDEKLFANVFNPPLRLIVVGAVHIAQSLVPIARECGFGVTVVDPRAAFLTEARFPGAVKSPLWPDEAMAELAIDTRTAVVVLSHDPKIDDPALKAALGSDAFYIGALGSKKNHERRRARLAEAGFDETALDRIHGPVGLDLGSKAPSEIALAIVAEMVQAKNRGAA